MGALVRLAAQRLLLADKVAAAKFGTDIPIEDPVREAQLLETVQRLSLKAGLDPEVCVRFFADQIEANKIVQCKLHELWRTRPELRPRRRPDLGREVRPRLDELTHEMVAELARAATAGPGSPDPHSLEQTLDSLHVEALKVAMRSVA